MFACRAVHLRNLPTPKLLQHRVC